MTYILARLGESATWAGIAAVLASLGINLPPGLWQNITSVGIALAGLAAFLIREKAGKAVPAPAADPHVLMASPMSPDNTHV